MLNDISVYLEDILRNKSMIKEMINTNVMAYEDKIEANKIFMEEMKQEIDRINSDFQMIENKRKLEYAKSHEQFQKHDINYKLLDKTNTYYNILIKEREEEVRKLEEQIIFACQDHQNKKVKLDCVIVQIIEAEFQLKNMQKMVEEKFNQIKNEENEKEYQERYENREDIKHDKKSNYSTELKNMKEYNYKTNHIDKYLSEKLEYKSSYHENQENANSSKTKENKSLSVKDNKSEMFDTITLNSEHLRKNSCIIF
jgi:hypothetical protein